MSLSRAVAGSATQGVRVTPGLRVPMADGARLSATLHLPRDVAEPLPALFVMTPYTAQRHHPSASYFAAHGYPVLTVDVRGRGDSDGEFHPLNDGADACEVIRWLAAQPFCDGRVAMWGGSYLAYCQWLAAAAGAPQLKAIAPTASPFYGVDVPLRNNVFPAYQAQWLSLVSGRAMRQELFADQPYWRGVFRDLAKSGDPFTKLADTIGEGAGLFREWIGRPEQGPYWDQYNPTPEQYRAIEIPVLTITGAYDGDQPGALHHYDQHLRHGPDSSRETHHLVIGPWDHGGCSAPKTEFCGLTVSAQAAIDLRALHLEWYDWVLKDGPRPVFLSDPVRYYVTGAEAWRGAASLAAVTAEQRRFGLSSYANPSDLFASGLLVPTGAASGGPDEYRFDPADTSLADLEASLDPADLTEQRLLAARRGGVLIYHTPPLPTDLDICGVFQAELHLAIDAPDTDIHVSVDAVAPDGAVLRLSEDWVRARYRRSLRHGELVETSEPLAYRFDRFPFVARRVPKGGRLRLVVGPLASIHQQRNYGAGGVVAEESRAEARRVTVRLHHDAVHPSVLSVPLGHAHDA